MAFTREYFSKVTLTLPQLKQLSKAQRDIYDRGIIRPDSNALSTLLSYATTILATIFASRLKTASSVASAIVSLVLGLVPSEKDVLKDLVSSGNLGIQELVDFMEANPTFDMIEVNLPFIHYETQDIRFVTGKGGITRVHTKNGWIVA